LTSGESSLRAIVLHRLTANEIEQINNTKIGIRHVALIGTDLDEHLLKVSRETQTARRETVRICLFFWPSDTASAFNKTRSVLDNRHRQNDRDRARVVRDNVGEVLGKRFCGRNGPGQNVGGLRPVFSK